MRLTIRISFLRTFLTGGFYYATKRQFSLAVVVFQNATYQKHRAQDRVHGAYDGALRRYQYAGNKAWWRTVFAHHIYLGVRGVAPWSDGGFWRVLSWGYARVFYPPYGRIRAVDRYLDGAYGVYSRAIFIAPQSEEISALVFCNRLYRMLSRLYFGDYHFIP